MSAMSTSSASFLSSVVDRQRSVAAAASSPRWACAAAAAALALAADLYSSWSTANRNPLTTSAEVVLMVTLAASATHALLSRLLPYQKDIVLSEAQMRLMHIDPKNHPGFKLTPKGKGDKPKHPNPFSPLRGNFLLPSPGSPASAAANASNSPGDVSSMSWTYHQQQADTSGPSPSQSSPTSPPQFAKFSSTVADESISDERVLGQYLDEYDAWAERSAAASLNATSNSAANSFEQLSPNLSGGGGGISFWKSPPSEHSFQRADYSPILKNLSYSLSTRMPESKTAGPDGDKGAKVDSVGGVEGGGGRTSKSDQGVCYRVGIDPLGLVSWMQNLRMWISQTVLVRVVAEIDDANRQLARLGMGDAALGEGAGLEKVKRLAAMHQQPGMPQQLMPAQLAAQLQNLVPFLEATTASQDYLVHRLRELARGGAMSGYRWNGGGSFRGREWSEKLPSDAEIAMHCVAAYFDSRLPPAHGVVDGRTFSSLHFFRMPEDKARLAKTRSNVAIVQLSARPPHYVLQIGDGESGRKLELSPGRNNLFHTLLLFLHHIKTKEGGMLDTVNLGRSGINILWVIDEESMVH